MSMFYAVWRRRILKFTLNGILNNLKF
jgi:hypothetical protein